MHQSKKTKTTNNNVPPLGHPRWKGICAYTNKAGIIYFRAYAGTSLEGKKITKSFRVFRAAEDWRKAKKIEIQNHGRKRLDVSDELIGKASRLEALCQTHGADIQEAVSYWIRHTRPEGGPITVAVLIKQYLADPVASKGWTDNHRKHLESTYKHFEKKFGSRLLYDLKSEEITDWILKPKCWGREEKGKEEEGQKGKSKPWSEKTMANNKISLSSMFAFAMRRKHLTVNPCDEVKLPKVPESAIRVLTIPECTGLLTTAWLQRETIGLLPYTILCLFAGLRPSEACRVTWRDIRHKSREPNIRAREHKDGINVERYVDIHPVLAKWIALCQGKEKLDDSILPPRCARAKDPFESAQRRFRLLRDITRIKEWGRDPMRHSFASYLYVTKKDIGYLRHQLGHEDGSIVTLKHYTCRRVQPEDGAKFWKLTPQFVLKDACPQTGRQKK